MGRIGGSSKRTTTFGMLAALAVILVIFYFVTAGRSSSDDGGGGENEASKANAGNGQATSSLLRGGTSEPTDWSSTETPTTLVFDADAFDWDELPPFAQSAASTLGYDRASWDSDGLRLRPWSGLSVPEREAAMALGFDADYWNDMVADGDADAATGTAVVDPDETRDRYVTDDGFSTATPTEVAWDGLDWEELPPEIRDAAGRLGYDERSWNDDAVFPGTMRHWIDLTPAEQAAAKTMGWNEPYWEEVVYGGPPEEDTEEPTTFEPTSEAWLEDDDEGDDDELETTTVSPSTETSVFEWEYASNEWRELPGDVRESAEFLGWDELTWCDGDPLPLRTETRWVGLSDAQKVAAAALGFSERTWDDVRRFLRQRSVVA